MMEKKGFPFNYQSSSLYQKDYNSLNEGQWLTGEVINLSFIFLNNDFQLPNVQLLDPALVSYLLFEDQEQELAKLDKLRLFGYDFLLIPINTNSDKQSRGDHWSLAVLDIKNWKLDVFDSTSKIVENIASLRATLTNLYRVLNSQNKERPIATLKKNQPTQSNSFDCGIYTIGFAEAFLQHIKNGKTINDPLSYKQIDFKGMRKRIKSRIDELMK